MDFLVGQHQSSFIANRSSCDNIIIAQEIIHFMITKPGRKGYAAIKVDMEKAYDRLEWDFIEHTLHRIGLQGSLIDVIMACVTSTSMKVLWNGEEGPSFRPTRGVRQGDPLSPYLFVLCMENLSHLILRERERRKWKPLSMKSDGPLISHLFFADDLLLFSEASVEQMRHVKRVMEQFCAVSGHRVNMDKSKVFFSRNVNMNRALNLGDLLGIGITANLGKYLGVPLIHSKITKANFRHVTSKVRARLSMWKGRHLSMAGRAVLIKSVISALPSYQMQSALIPIGVLKEIDQISRSFLWCQDENAKKMHLIAWDMILKQKQYGGLGIKDLQQQNKAYIMKLCWGLITKPDALWVKVLRSKYECGVNTIPTVLHKKHESLVWQAITRVWDNFLQGVGMKVNNRCTTKFWWDRWSTLDKPLIEYANANIDLIDPDEVVAGFKPQGDVWNIGRWRTHLPNWVVQTLCRIQPPRLGQEDMVCWRPSSDGRFTVKAAYQFLSKPHKGRENRIWRSIWRWPLPEKVKFFLWQVSHERIMTNSMRAKRGIIQTGICPLGCPCEERIIHMLRDCDRAKQVWRGIIRSDHFSAFFSSDLQEWLQWNATHNPSNSRLAQWNG